MIAATIERQDISETAARAFASRCFLVTLNVRRWRGGDLVEDASIESGGEKVDSNCVSNPRWRLITPEWNKTFNRLESRARAQLDWFSVRSPIHGSSFVPTAAAENLFNNLEKLRREFDAQVKLFCSQEKYDEMLAERRASLGEKIWAVAGSHIPSLEDMARRFSMSWFIVPVGSPQSEEGVSDVHGYLAGARAGYTTALEESVTRMVREPRLRLREKVKRLRIQLDNVAGSLRQVSLDSVTTALRGFANWSFACDSDTLNASIELADALASITAEQLNEDEKREGHTIIGEMLKLLDELLDNQEAISLSMEKLAMSGSGQAV